MVLPSVIAGANKNATPEMMSDAGPMMIPTLEQSSPPARGGRLGRHRSELPHRAGVLQVEEAPGGLGEVRDERRGIKPDVRAPPVLHVRDPHQARWWCPAPQVPLGRRG